MAARYTCQAAASCCRTLQARRPRPRDSCGERTLRLYRQVTVVSRIDGRVDLHMPRKPRTRAAKPTTGARWILFMPTIPAKPASVRVRIWRRLQAIGAVNIRGAVYVLPNREECAELFEWLAQELLVLGGQASLCEGRFVDDASDDDIERRFVDVRNSDYEEVATA